MISSYSNQSSQPLQPYQSLQPLSSFYNPPIRSITDPLPQLYIPRPAFSQPLPIGYPILTINNNNTTQKRRKSPQRWRVPKNIVGSSNSQEQIAQYLNELYFAPVNSTPPYALHGDTQFEVPNLTAPGPLSSIPILGTPNLAYPNISY